MPIKIVLTDIGQLSVKEIEDLYNYLMSPKEAPSLMEPELEVKKSNSIVPQGALSLSIYELNLSTRTCNFLKVEGIITVRNLVQWTENQLLSAPNCGKKSLNEIKDALAEKGLMLATPKEIKTEVVHVDKPPTFSTMAFCPQIPAPDEPLLNIRPTNMRQDVTYDELIAYVLDNTKTKKLEYNRVMDILTQFEVPNLNALVDMPHLLNPVYQSIKEVTK